ncbi:hypothetical protein LINGRAHAP2_LOCUS31419, partial [Linum grandiflorum]
VKEEDGLEVSAHYCVKHGLWPKPKAKRKLSLSIVKAAAAVRKKSEGEEAAAVGCAERSSSSSASLEGKRGGKEARGRGRCRVEGGVDGGSAAEIRRSSAAAECDSRQGSLRGRVRESFWEVSRSRIMFPRIREVRRNLGNCSRSLAGGDEFAGEEE